MYPCVDWFSPDSALDLVLSFCVIVPRLDFQTQIGLEISEDEMNHFLCYAEVLGDLYIKVPSIGVIKRLSSENRIF